MKRTVVNTVLITTYILITAVVILPLFLEFKIEKAETFQKNYMWGNADKTYKEVLKIYPFNAEYMKKYGDFLVRRSGYQKDKFVDLKEAQGIYERALSLNGKNAEYWLSLGNVYLDISESEIKLDKNVLDCFKKAAENDQNGFWINYLKEFNLVESITPQTLDGYKRLYNYITINNLWQYRRSVIDRMDYYSKKEYPEEFQRIRAEKIERIENIKKKYRDELKLTKMHSEWLDTRGRYNDGNIYCTGTVDAGIYLPAGKATIKIKAKGSSAESIWPYMIVELDGEVIGELFVGSPEWKEYTFGVKTGGGVKVLSVTFINDSVVIRRGVREDRNLFVGNIEID